MTQRDPARERTAFTTAGREDGLAGDPNSLRASSRPSSWRWWRSRPPGSAGLSSRCSGGWPRSPCCGSGRVSWPAHARSRPLRPEALRSPRRPFWRRRPTLRGHGMPRSGGERDGNDRPSRTAPRDGGRAALCRRPGGVVTHPAPIDSRWLRDRAVVVRGRLGHRHDGVFRRASDRGA